MATRRTVTSKQTAPKSKAKPRAKTSRSTKQVSGRTRSPSRSPLAAKRSLAFSNNGWTARPHQQELYDAMQRVNRAILIWHRRAGKDSFSMNYAKKRMDEEPGSYWHMFPLHSQARRAIWWGMDVKGKRFIDQAFPEDDRRKVYQQDMLIEMENGATWQLLGSDYYDRLVGANTKGVVFSEWSLCDPRAWEFIRPILRENKGWAIFITTYRGRNHAYQMVQRLKDSPDWYVDVKTVEDTTDGEGNRLLTDADIDAERRDGMVESLIQQEYYCNPLAAATGAVYANSLDSIGNQRGDFPYDPRLPIYAAWSFEFAPANISVLLVQPIKDMHRVVWSKSFMFTGFSDCLAAIPYRVHRHVIRNEHRDWEDVLTDLRLQVEITKPIHEGKIPTITSNLLEKSQIDIVPRREHEIENNENLLASLNGYTLKEVDHETWSNKPEMTHDIYIVRALECYSIYAHQESDVGSWHRAPNYKQRDRAVI